MSKITISAIVASAKNRVIGDGEQLFWKISEDFRRLKEITMGCPLIMGRKTWDSIGKPLPGRASIVLTRNSKWQENGAIKVSSIEEGINIGTNWLNNNGRLKKEIFIFGGMDIYNLGLVYCDYIYLTEVDIYPESKYVFPIIDPIKWKLIFESKIKKSNEGIKYKFLTYKKITQK